MRFDEGRNRRYTASLLALTAAVLLALAGVAGAQGTQTGQITGQVTSPDGAALPGVTVSVKSTALQGERTAVSDSQGGYIFRGLPPGEYTVSFNLTGFTTVERKLPLALGENRPMDQSLTVATVQETVEVTAEAPSILSSTQVGQNFRGEQIDKLGTNRTLSGIAELAPGLTDNGSNLGQLAIAGAFSYDNVFLLNGVDINDNLFGTANNLFIEDAVEEVQVLTNGISAEYGRFSGGVINAVTKRGGNTFSGSARLDLTNPSWQDERAFEKTAIAEKRPGAVPHTDRTNKFWQFTLGGPILKDHLWFFGAYRREKSAEPGTLSNTGIGYNLEVENPRYEGKLTGSINANHTFSGTYIKNDTQQANRPSINATMSIDPRTLVSRTLPNNLMVVNYNGVLTSNLFAEAQYSRKEQGFRGTGGTSTDILDSPMLALGRAGIPASRHYNAPYFDSNDPEDRNNNQYTAALSYFLSTGSAGRHDLKFGGEKYTSSRTGGNSQSSTGFVFQTDPLVTAGVPVQDANGRFIPMFVPGATRIQNWLPVRGAQINLNTTSLYVNDRWQLNNHWNFNLGVRYERHTADTTQAGIVTPESSAFVPRLGATFDVKGDGRWVLKASYAHYAGKAAETQFADNTNVGTPSLVLYQYRATAPVGQGLGFAPGFDLANYEVIGGSFPVRNIFLDSGLKTPLTKEWTLAAGTRLGRKGEVQLTYTNRSTGDILDDLINDPSAAGKTTVVENGRTFGTFDNVFISNSDIPFRDYQSLQLQSSYRVTDTWSLSGHYTMQLKNEGNFEGEAANQPGSYSIILDRPEFYAATRHFPAGNLVQYQKHKVRVFSTYDLGLGPAGRASLGLLYRYDSPLSFSYLSANVAVTAAQRARNPGYASPPTTQTLFYEGRGTGRFEEAHIVDLALNYEVPVWRSARPYLKAELRNAFNAQPLIGFDTTVTPNATGGVDELGLATSFTKGPNFGKATVLTHNPESREVRFSVGFRF